MIGLNRLDLSVFLVGVREPSGRPGREGGPRKPTARGRSLLLDSINT